MKPPREELDAKARHFANTVFVIGAGAIMLAASLLQPLVANWLGPAGNDATFIAATLFILMLASGRSRFALYAIGRQCEKFGHTPDESASICSRCFQGLTDTPPLG